MTAPAMRAFRNDPAVRDYYLARVRAHAAADEIVQGVTWKNGRGCAIGCTLHGYDHAAYETELGISAQIAHLEDAIFEALPKATAKAWPLRFLAAVPLGADLSHIWPEFAAWMMDDPTYGVASTTDDAEVKALALDVARMYRARDTSGAAAEALADRLRAARAAWAARAARAARAVWDAWAAWDARDAFVAASAEKLLALLAVSPSIVSEEVAS